MCSVGVLVVQWSFSLRQALVAATLLWLPHCGAGVILKQSEIRCPAPAPFRPWAPAIPNPGGTNCLFSGRDLLHAGIMIEVCSPPVIDQEPGGDYTLCFWVLDVFNYSTPFRSMIAELALTLALNPDEDLRLPAYSKDEDFIEGSLVLGSNTLRVYFEHARSYLSLSHPRKQVLADILDRLSPQIRLRG